MKTMTVLMAGLLIAVAPATALAAKKMKREYEVPLKKVDTNEASYRFARDAMPIFLPSWSMPFYMKMKDDEAARVAQAEPKKRKRYAKR